uniref:Uncharacterized protein n=1 Tax=Parastrongyloides trichosuri TaxID=131310 RepID=A0A0N5A7A5_PARTI
MAVTDASTLSTEKNDNRLNETSSSKRIQGMLNNMNFYGEIKNNNIRQTGGAVYFSQPTNMAEEVQNLYFESVHFSIDDEEKLLLEDDMDVHNIGFGKAFRNKTTSKIQSFIDNRNGDGANNNSFHNISLSNNRSGTNFSRLTRLTNDDTDQDSPLDELNLILPISGTSFPNVKPTIHYESTWSKIKNVLFCCYPQPRGSNSMGILN